MTLILLDFDRERHWFFDFDFFQKFKCSVICPSTVTDFYNPKITKREGRMTWRNVVERDGYQGISTRKDKRQRSERERRKHLNHRYKLERGSTSLKGRMPPYHAFSFHYLRRGGFWLEWFLLPSSKQDQQRWNIYKQCLSSNACETKRGILCAQDNSEFLPKNQMLCCLNQKMQTKKMRVCKLCEKRSVESSELTAYRDSTDFPVISNGWRTGKTNMRQSLGLHSSTW